MIHWNIWLSTLFSYGVRADVRRCSLPLIGVGTSSFMLILHRRRAS